MINFLDDKIYVDVLVFEINLSLFRFYILPLSFAP